MVSLSFSALVSDLTNTFTTSDGVIIDYDIYYQDNLNSPILVLSDAFSPTSTRVQMRILAQWYAEQGFYVINVDTRGKGDSGGVHDLNGFECLELAEVITKERVLNSQYMNNLNYIGGVSGGGGTTQTCISKYPDLFNAAFSMFGISDYGLWYSQNPSYQSNLITYLGVNPTQNLETYNSRSSMYSYKNIFTPLILLHNDLDTSVPSTQSLNLYNALNAIGREVSYIEGDITHGFTPEIIYRDISVDYLNSFISTISLPNKNTYTIQGYLKSKKFDISLTDVNKLVYLNYDETFINEIKIYFTATTYNDLITMKLKGLIPNTYYNVKNSEGSTVNSGNSDNNGELILILEKNINYAISKNAIVYNLNKYKLSMGNNVVTIWTDQSLVNKFEVLK